MDVKKAIDQVSICYGVNISGFADEKILDYKNYDIRLSIQYIKKIADIVKPEDRQKFEIVLLMFELNSFNPFWSVDLYKIITNGSSIFKNIISEYSGMLLEVDVSIDKFLRSAKNSDEDKLRKYLNNLFDTIFNLLRFSRLLLFGDNGTYVIFEDRNSIYTISSIGKITLSKFEPGICDSEPRGIWDSKRDINELDKLVGFNTSYLRLFRKKITSEVRV